jgi:hypothetical protein
MTRSGWSEVAFTDEPAVLTWMIALAPRPSPEPMGRHWWRELVTDAWRSAYQAWWLEREAFAIGYSTEMEEFEAANPAPRLRDFMVHMSSGQWAP